MVFVGERLQCLPCSFVILLLHQREVCLLWMLCGLYVITLTRLNRLENQGDCLKNMIQNRLVKMSKWNISTWIWSYVQYCYKTANSQLPGKPKAYCTRRNAAIAALLGNVTSVEMCRSATWKSVHTKHYCIDSVYRAGTQLGEHVIINVFQIIGS